MRQYHCCTKCGHKRIWVVDRVFYALDTYGFEVMAMSVAKVANRDTRFPPKMAGKFEALICANPACGYTEWHAYDLEALTELAKDPKSGVRMIDSEPGSPYR